MNTITKSTLRVPGPRNVSAKVRLTRPWHEVTTTYLGCAVASVSSPLTADISQELARLVRTEGTVDPEETRPLHHNRLPQFVLKKRKNCNDMYLGSTH